MNFTKVAKDLQTDNYKRLLKEIEEDTDVFRTGRLNIVKMAILSELIYRFSEIAIKILISFFLHLMHLLKNRKPILKVTWIPKDPEYIQQ